VEEAESAEDLYTEIAEKKVLQVASGERKRP
jgi:hypothetical protein